MVDAGGVESSVLIAYPGVLDGEIRVKVDMEFSGAGAHWRKCLSRGKMHRVDALWGYRYLRLEDRFLTREALTSLDPSSGFATGSEISRFDTFRAQTEFHGGELGFSGRFQRGCWSFELLGKTAIGVSHYGLLIDGGTTVNDAGAITTYDSGVLAQSPDLGSYTDDKFSFVSELGVSANYDLGCQCRLTIGYTIVYWSDVARVLDYVDRTVDPALIPPSTGPGTATPVVFDPDSFGRTD